MKKTTIMIATLSLMLGACATGGIQAESSEDAAASAIAAAQVATDKVAKVGYEWRDTRDIIEEAKKAAEAKDYDKAAKLAHKAEAQSVEAMKQYESQKNAGKTH